MTMLTTCLLGEPIVLSKFRFVRSHGNLISSNMSFAGTNTLENKLYEIAFDNNQITTLKKNDFSNYTELRVLSLRKNRITTIEIGALPSPGNLEVLDIGNNLLDSNSICYLKNLTEVWKNVSIVAEYITDGNVLSIDNYQQCSDDTGTTDTDTISTAMPRASSTGIL
ncbi:uncharacterized protein LOC143049204 [Mytilus galloprovincialis]|uniref:uncharacterized protein LOC143049204 n=1 Tax=Mytilus galloprovincialis TaxID=29158 RepID=UPI003F7B3D6F